MEKNRQAVKAEFVFGEVASIDRHGNVTVRLFNDRLVTISGREAQRSGVALQVADRVECRLGRANNGMSFGTAPRLLTSKGERHAR